MTYGSTLYAEAPYAGDVDDTPTIPAGQVTLHDTVQVTPIGARASTGQATVTDHTIVAASGARVSAGQATLADQTTLDTAGARTSRGQVTVTDQATVAATGARASVGQITVRLLDRVTTVGARSSTGLVDLLDRVALAVTGGHPTRPAPPARGAADITTRSGADTATHAHADAYRGPR